MEGENQNQNTALTTTEPKPENGKKRKSRPLYFDPALANFEKLDPLARRVLTVETANPGIPVAEIIRIITAGGWKGDQKTIYGLRKRPEYQRLLLESQKSEYQVWADLQREAAHRLRKHLNSGSEKISLDATKFILSHTKEIEIKKAEMQLTLEIERTKAEQKYRHEVEVVFSSPLPIPGQATVDDSGRIVPIAPPQGEPAQPEAAPEAKEPEPTPEAAEEDTEVEVDSSIWTDT